jgi:hypothetical protein
MEEMMLDLLDLFGVMPLLTFQIDSITVVNTGLNDCEVDRVDWIDEKRIGITNKVDCVYDDGFGGTCVASVDEFDWSFKKRDFTSDAYVFIALK